MGFELRQLLTFFYREPKETQPFNKMRDLLTERAVFNWNGGRRRSSPHTGEPEALECY